MKWSLFLLLLVGCHHTAKNESLSLIQIQDRNGLTETVSNPERLTSYETTDFLSSQPYRKVLRVYKSDAKNRSYITTYHPNGLVYQYLEAEEMRAHGAYREWFPNGQLKIEARVIGGTADLADGTQEDWVFDSESRVWDEQGHLAATIPYSKGFIEGKSRYYYPSAQIQKELDFIKNKLDGNVTEYWPDGTLKSRTAYKKGFKEGECVGFFEDGKKAWVEDHSDDRLRTGVYYNPQGDLIAEVEKGGGFAAHFEENGMTLIEHRIGLPEGLVRKFTLRGELQRSFFLKNGMKQGEEIEYFLSSEIEAINPSPKQVTIDSARQSQIEADPAPAVVARKNILEHEDFRARIDMAKPQQVDRHPFGARVNKSPVPKLSIQWNENRIHGCVKTWYKNGQLQSQRDYSRNQRMGPSLAWYLDGSLMLYEEYEEGHLTTGQYYKMQKKDPISSVVNGNGLATLFDERGGFLRKVIYSKGKPIDPEE